MRSVKKWAAAIKIKTSDLDFKKIEWAATPWTKKISSSSSSKRSKIISGTFCRKDAQKTVNIQYEINGNSRSMRGFISSFLRTTEVSGQRPITRNQTAIHPRRRNVVTGESEFSRQGGAGRREQAKWPQETRIIFALDLDRDAYTRNSSIIF